MQEERSNPIDIQALVPLLELSNRVGHVYGSEDISMLFYSLIRRERPVNLLELGTGLGVTAFWMAQAVKENGEGRVWTIDNGVQWNSAEQLGAGLGSLLEVAPFDSLEPSELTYDSFIENAMAILGLQDQLTFVKTHLDLTQEEAFYAQGFGFLEKPIDFVFLDFNRTPDDILDSLHLLLPHLADCASVFVDSASTSLTSYLFLEQLVEQLNRSKVPRRFLAGASPERRRVITDLIAQRKFTLVHLIERVNRAQNSTAWIKIEPNDFVPHPQALMKWV